MKRNMILILILAISVIFAACNTGSNRSGTQTETPRSDQTENTSQEPESGTARTLVVYFSNTGNTETVARLISNYTNGDLFEIEAAVPYTEEDLDYSNSESRTSKEQNDNASRPEIANTLENPGDYDVIFLGYPIWWGQAPKIMYTFLESYDFSESTIVPFCTSGSSGIGTSAENLQAITGTSTQWKSGQRLSGSVGEDEIQSWIDELDLNLR